jgi:capsular polysaccharide biosynthesis protein
LLAARSGHRPVCSVGDVSVLAAVTDFTGAPLRTYSVGEPVSEVSRVLLATGGQQTSTTPMLWPTGLDIIDQSHAETGQAPDIGYYLIPGATLAGGGALPRIGETYFHASGVLPEYVAHYVRNDMDSQHWQSHEGSHARHLPVGISILHNNLVFGHWLLEMFPKLLMLRSMAPELRGAPIILPSTAPAYVHQTVAAVLGDWPVYVYDRFAEHVNVDVLIAPEMFHRGYHFNPRFETAIDDHIAWARGSLGAKARAALGLNPRKLFITRRDVNSSFRRLINTPALEAVATALGFTVIRPETIAWRRQVEMFSYAECIVGEFGSGMHNALFAPHGAKVVCLNWIVDVQSRIANFRRQSVGYVLPTGDELARFKLDRSFVNYQVDPERCRAAILQACGSR